MKLSTLIQQLERDLRLNGDREVESFNSWGDAGEPIIDERTYSYGTNDEREVVLISSESRDDS